MDKPRHPNVIRTWNQRRPVHGITPIKNDPAAHFPVRGIPAPPTPKQPHPKDKTSNLPEKP